MATRIAHISDLHFPAKSVEQVAALNRSIMAMKPDFIVVTGDLTRSGTREEFRQAKAFLDSLPLPTLVVPGNHDVPVPGVWSRIFAPFKRYEGYLTGPSTLESADVLVVGMNTAVGWQLSLDWSLGYIVPRRLDDVASTMDRQRGGRLGIVACHHPLHEDSSDPIRSRTFGGEAAFDRLVRVGMSLLLHGHLHRTLCHHSLGPGALDVGEVCANTALSNRERGGPAGYNIVDVEYGRWQLSTLNWDGAQYVLL